jgi:hypothetical protein
MVPGGAYTLIVNVDAACTPAALSGYTIAWESATVPTYTNGHKTVITFIMVDSTHLVGSFVEAY